MIKFLSISNFALIDKVEIGFSEGFSVVTGETGAGKSVILNALSLVLGGRADVSLLMDKNVKSVVELVFFSEDEKLKTWFEFNELDYSPDIILRREIYPGGRSRGFINDSPVNNAILKEFGDFCIDIHSQNRTFLMSDMSYRTSLVDAYCGISSEVRAFSAAYETWSKYRNEYVRKVEEAEKREKEREYLSFRYSQLCEAGLKTGEGLKLEEEAKILSNTEEIRKRLGNLFYMLRDADSAILLSLKDAVKEMNGLTGIYSPAEDYAARLDSIILELRDIADGAEHDFESITGDETGLDAVNARLNELNDLVFKYRVKDFDALIDERERLEVLLKEMDVSSENIQRMKIAVEEMEKDLEKRAEIIHKRRMEAKDSLSEGLKSSLKNLGIKHAEFEVEIKAGEKISIMGKDEVNFLFSANKNQKPVAVEKVASGGELSRIVFAIKYMMSDKLGLSAIVFDEIDTGLSGEIALRMGRMMREMGDKMQVISVTHLPQIAGLGQHHFKVYKEDDARQTFSKITLLDKKERVEEIASMIGGEEKDKTLSAARSLIDPEYFEK